MSKFNDLVIQTEKARYVIPVSLSKKTALFSATTPLMIYDVLQKNIQPQDSYEKLRNNAYALIKEYETVAEVRERVIFVSLVVGRKYSIESMELRSRFQPFHETPPGYGFCVNYSLGYRIRTGDTLSYSQDYGSGKHSQTRYTPDDDLVIDWTEDRESTLRALTNEVSVITKKLLRLFINDERLTTTLDARSQILKLEE